MRLAAVRLRGVRKRFGARGGWVLNGVDLELAPGSTTIVVGANGAGKSTLLRIVAGLLRPTAGRVDDRAATIGYAPDRLGSRARMSARVYVEHMARIRGADELAARGDAQRLFDCLGLLPDPDVPIRSLSKGNSQKVALAQALIAPVDLLVLDEPFGGLDMQARDAIAEIVGERAGRGAAVLISAHAPLDSIAAALTLRLHAGQLVAAGPGVPRGVRIVLVSGAASLDDTPIRDRPGIVGIRRDATKTTLTVESAFSDAVLAFALERGLSVVSVTPITGSDGGGR